MRILMLTQHFPPEITAGRFRAEAFVGAMLDRGHEVHVVCAVPNHPRGVIEPTYRNRLLVRKRQGGLRVSYVWVRTGVEKSFRLRLANYVSYAAMAAGVGSSLCPRPDVVLASSPPLTVGMAGAFVATRYGAPFVLDVRDLWPRAAVVLGELSDSRAIGLAELFERWLYGRADVVTTVTEPFAEHIGAQAPADSRIAVVPNGTTGEWLAWGDRESDREALGLPPDRFVLAYAGNLGLYHSLDVAIEAARRLDDDFHLLLVGHGPLRDQLERQASELPPGRVRFTGLVAPERAAAYLRASDALLVSLNASLTDVLSSKLFDCCAMRRPVIVAAGGETRRVVEEADAALTIAPEAPGELADAVRSLRADRGLRERLARAGRALAKEYLRERQAETMVDLLEAAYAVRSNLQR